MPKSSKIQFSACFAISGGLILFLTGAAKLLSSIGRQKLLNLSDPVFGLHFKTLLLLAGALEIVISILCLSSPKKPSSIILLAWISTSFLAYRIGMHLSGWNRPCPCLGGFTDQIHISWRVSNLITNTALLYLLAGSYLCLLQIITTRVKQANTRP